MLLLIPLANAAPYQDHGLVLRGAGPFDAGVSAPAVEWDGAQYVMFFEAPFADADVPTGCNSAYQIGRATSPDGQVWSIDLVPVLSPEPEVVDSPRACAVNQPAVVFDGHTWHLFFTQSGKPESQASSAGGVAYATSTNGTDFTLVGDPVIPASTNGIGLASAAIDGDQLYLVYSRTPDIYAATMDLDGGKWTIGADPVLTAAEVGPRAGSRVIAPSLWCADGDGLALTMVVGADDAAEARVLVVAGSGDGASWTVESGNLDLGALDPDLLGHWDLLAVGAGTTALWYSTDDAGSGFKAIGVAATGSDFSGPHSRACNLPPPVDTGDTGDTGSVDTGESGDTAGPDSGETGVSPRDSDDTKDTGAAGEGCACSTPGPTGSWAALGLLALMVRRRR